MKLIFKIATPMLLAATVVGGVVASRADGPSAPPDPHYKVVDEADTPAMPGLAEALAKVRVPPPPKDVKAPPSARVVLTTSQGPITVELNGKAAPLHVKSFLYLAKRGFFDGTQFHRYEPGFVIQGGDPLSKDEDTRQFSGMGGPGYQIPREKNRLQHDRFVLAAARTNDPDSAGSQFYFTLEPTPFLDDGEGYTVFGKVVASSDNVLKLRKGDTIEKIVDASPVVK